LRENFGEKDKNYEKNNSIRFCGTFNFNSGARLFGSTRLGVIKAATFADIIAVEGNPADDFNSIEKVRFVMKNGKVYLENK
jgi:hypothetical protein